MTAKQKRNFGVHEESSLELSLQQLGLSANDIDAVSMTHMHFDHACG
jgi:glyoxylase-like metal-dependent hydrolase (beta-lactamase superfamily II)